MGDDEFEALFERLQGDARAVRADAVRDRRRTEGLRRSTWRPRAERDPSTWFAGHAPRQALRQLLPDADLRRSRRSLDGISPDAAPPDAGQVLLQLHAGRRAAVRRARGADPPAASRPRPATRAGVQRAGARMGSGSDPERTKMEPFGRTDGHTHRPRQMSAATGGKMDRELVVWARGAIMTPSRASSRPRSAGSMRSPG